MATHDDFDVCVIGTGAGGGVMLQELTAAGFRVVALQRGPFLQPAQFDDDELRTVLRDAATTLKTKFTDIKAVVYFDVKKRYNWRINTSASSASAFRYLAKTLQGPSPGGPSPGGGTGQPPPG